MGQSERDREGERWRGRENVQDIHKENNKTLLKVINKDLNKWRDISCTQTGRLNIVKMSVLPKLI